MYSPVPFVLFAWLWAYAPTVVSGQIRNKMPEGYDNRHPRAQQARATGLAARAIAAHQNGLEAFPAFAAASILCAWKGGDPGTATILSVTFVVARIAYTAFYFANLHVPRSAVWVVGMGCILGLFLLAWGK